MILINTENFDWKALREARLVFLNARLESSSKENPLVTELMTIKVLEQEFILQFWADITSWTFAV